MGYGKWIMEMIGKGPGVKGAVWVAVRIPDDCIAAHANQSRIHKFDMNDKENCLYSPDVISFAREKGYFSGVNKDFSFADAYCPLDFSGLRFCEARVWSFYNMFSKSTGQSYLSYIQGDSLYVLTNGFEKMTPAELDVETIIANYKKAGLENFIVNLQGDNHKNVTWSFRYVNPDKAGVVTEEGEANEFLFESNIYNENGLTSTGKATKGFDKAVAGSIAPQYAAWLKMHNGCLVLTDASSTFGAAKTGGDGALVFNAYSKTEEQLVS